MPMTLYLMGIAYANLGQYKDAVSTYRQSIKYKPDLALARFQLGLVSLELGDQQSAREQ